MQDTPYVMDIAVATDHRQNISDNVQNVVQILFYSLISAEGSFIIYLPSLNIVPSSVINRLIPYQGTSKYTPFNVTRLKMGVRVTKSKNSPNPF